jgi:hypothetical protein
MTMKAETASYGNDIVELKVDSNYIYVGGAIQKVFQYWKSNLTIKKTVAYGGYVYAIDDDDTYVYAGGATSFKVKQYWKSNMTMKAETASYGGQINCILVDSATYISPCNYSFNVRNLLNVMLYHYRAYATNINGTAYGSDETFLTKPNEPTAFSGSYTSPTTVNLTWTKGTGANYTRIQRKVGSYPTNISDGSNVCNITGSYFVDTVVVDTVYYYSAWSYATWDGLQQWSDTYTNPLILIVTNNATGVEETNATLRGNILYSYLSSLTGRYEWVTGGDSGYGQMYSSSTWRGQTFTVGTVAPNINHWVTSITVYLKRTGVLTGQTAIASIRATDGSYPIGADLCSGSINAATISTSGAQYTFTMSTKYPLLAGTKYAICVRSSGTVSVSNCLGLLLKTSSIYPGGNQLVSSAGTSWSTGGGGDHNFEIWDESSDSYASFEYGISISYGSTTSDQTISSGTYTANVISFAPGTLYHYHARTTFPVYTNGNDKTFLTKPNEPTGLTVTDTASGQQTLTWTHGTGYNQSVVRGTIGSYPATPQSGVDVYNSTGNSVVRNGLTGGDDWYYRVWEYTVWGSEFKFSDGNASNHLLALTTPSVSGNLASLVEETTAQLNANLVDTGGESCTVRFQYGLTLGYGTNTTNQIVGVGVFIQAIASLTQGTLYHYRAYANNSLFSSVSGDVTFLTKPNEPTGLNAVAISSTRIDLTWSKGTGADYTRIQRDTAGYPATISSGVNVYNGTGSSYSNIGLTEGQIYYYRAWSFASDVGWNQWSDSYSSDVELTYPDAPTSTGIVLLNATHIGLTWTKGAGAEYTVVLRKTTGIPASVTDGTVVYNGTESSYNDTLLAGVTLYYKAWSYAEDAPLHKYSINGTEFASSTGLALEAFSEDDCSGLVGYNILVSNQDGSHVYVLNNITGGIGINASLCPQGLVSILVSCNGYRSRVYYLTISSGIFFYLNAYLPLNTTSELYMITVVGDKNEYGNSPPLDHVAVTVKTYINCTGQYETVTNLYTDAYGQCDMYLRSTLYKVTLQKTGYTTTSEDYIPNVDLRTRTFRLSISAVAPEDNDYLFRNITYSITPKGQVHYGSFTIVYTIASSDNQLEWFSLEVTKYNVTSKLWDQIYFSNQTNASGGTISYTVANVTGRYAAEFWFKKIGFDAYKMTEIGSIQYSIEKVKQALVSIPDYAYFIAVLVIMALVMGFAMPYAGIGTGYIGLIIMAIALLLKPVSIAVGHAPGDVVSGWWIFGVTFLMYTVGIFLWSRL